MIKAKKYYGQNFLFSKQILENIVSLASIDNKKVIEIGPGLGGLTQFLVKKALSVVAIEVDSSLKPHLDEIVNNNNNIEVIYNNFLEIDLKEYKDYVIVGNIPYNISSLILTKFLYSDLLEAVLLVQKEFGERLISSPHSKTYGELSVFTQYFCSISKLRNIGRTAFYPAPKVDSVLIKLKRIRKFEDNIIEKSFLKFIKIAFQMKRKTLINNLLTLNIEREKIVEILNKNNFDLNIRAEEINVQDLLLLSKEFSLWLE